jgi:hypothetical protein
MAGLEGPPFSANSSGHRTLTTARTLLAATSSDMATPPSRIFLMVSSASSLASGCFARMGSLPLLGRWKDVFCSMNLLAFSVRNRVLSGPGVNQVRTVLSLRSP